MSEEEPYGLIFSALKHPIRRKILRILGRGQANYSELLEALGMGTGHLNYHLKAMEPLLNKSDDGVYSLSGYGRIALRTMREAEEPRAAHQEALRGFPSIKAVLPMAFLVLALAVLVAYQYSTISGLRSEIQALSEKISSLTSETTTPPSAVAPPPEALPPKTTIPPASILAQLEQMAPESPPRVERLAVDQLITSSRRPTSGRPWPSVLLHEAEFRQGDIFWVFIRYSWSLADPPSDHAEMGFTLDDICVTIIGDRELFGLIRQLPHDVLFGEFLVEQINESTTIFSAALNVSLEILDAKGRSVAQKGDFEWFGGGGSSNSEREEHEIFVRRIPYEWEPGNYTLIARVKDLITGLEDSRSAQVSIKPAPEPYPWPMYAEPWGVILKGEDLPEGWTLARTERDSWPFLEGFVASGEASFKNEVGNATSHLFVKIVQFEDIGYAMRHFDEMLGSLYASGWHERTTIDVQMLDLGDLGVLMQRPWRRTAPSGGYWYVCSVMFKSDNVVVTLHTRFDAESVRLGIYLAPSELVGLARTQEQRILSGS